MLRTGRTLYAMGEQTIKADEGDILLGLRDVPHKFVNLSPGGLESIHVHLSPELIQTDLDEPEISTHSAPAVMTGH